MKLLYRLRYWLLCGVLVLVLGGLFHALNQRANTEGGAWQRAALVASLVDESTTVLVHLPSINETGRAYSEADLARLWQMSALQELLARPLAQTPVMRVLKPYWKRCLALQAKEAVLAVDLSGDQPQLLVAFQSNRDLSDVWKPARSWLQDKCQEPAPEVIEEQGDVTFRRVGTGNEQIVQARWKDWVLTGTQDVTVRRALGRLRSNTNLDSLALSAPFKRALQALPSDYLSLSYLNTSQVHSLSASRQEGPPIEPLIRHVGKIVKAATEAHLQAIALTSSIRDGKMVDRARILTEEAAMAPSESVQAALNLTSPKTHAFFAAALGSAPVRNQVLAPFIERWQASQNTVLQEAASQAKTLFADGWSFQLEPIEGSSENELDDATTLLLAFLVNDSELAQAWLSQIAEQEYSGVTRTGPDSFSFDVSWLGPPASHLLTALHVRVAHGFMHFADSSRGLHQVLRRWKLENLTSRADFRKLSRQLPTPDVGLGFVDANSVLAHSYEALRHPLVIGTLWMGLRSQTNLAIDFSRLDREGAPSDLSPTVIVLSRTADGFRQASVGSLSPSQWAIGSGLAVALINKTFLQPLPSETAEPPAIPDTEAELLRLMEQP